MGRKEIEYKDSLFFNNISSKVDNNQIKLLIDSFKDYSEKKNKQVYITADVLGNKKEFIYKEIKDFFYVLLPKYPIFVFINDNVAQELIDDFELDLKIDLYALARKYDYEKILGGVRSWSNKLFRFIRITDFDFEDLIANPLEESFHREIELLISLIIGSINDIEKIGNNAPKSLLEKVKQKIVLFDAKQSGFIYKTTRSKRIIIQGMAGTGKTELLLHKLKEIYSLQDDKRIVFTCHNKVLANDMKKRIPKFFDFMKIDKQIDWYESLHVFSSWGSYNDPSSGLYSYICNEYRIPFKTYSSVAPFDTVCVAALDYLNKIDNFKECFDFIFIDESQDFSESFFKLCEKISTDTVFIAGDIFQNIFDTKEISNINPDFLLNNCYRTDPRTFMFAHAVGLGLYEKLPISWLEDKVWKACGYIVDKTDKEYKLSRKPLRRFEDLESSETLKFLSVDYKEYDKEIIKILKTLKQSNETLIPDDVCIIILGGYKSMCKFSDRISLEIFKEFKWNSTKGYETRRREEGSVYISNINHIKGLEFPFVICVSLDYISNDIRFRNSIYMALTRSFLTSYFIINSSEEDFYRLYSKAIKDIDIKGYLCVKEPSEKEKEIMKNQVDISLNAKQQNIQLLINSIFEKKYPKIPSNARSAVESTLNFIVEGLTQKEIEKKLDELVSVVWKADK